MRLGLVALSFVLVNAADHYQMDAIKDDMVIRNNEICSIAEPTNCYPLLFQATNEFQAIRPGQQIPKGLHVRIDYHTGFKEAKLNNDDGTAADSLPVLVPSSEAEADTQKMPKITLKTEKAGKVTRDEKDSLTILLDRLESANITDAIPILEHLTEVGREVDIGLAIAQSGKMLLELLDGKVFQHVARLLGSIASNNPKAQDELISFRAIPKLWKTLLRQSEPDSVTFSALCHLVRSNIAGMDEFVALQPQTVLKLWLKTKIRTKVVDLVSDLYNPEMRPDSVKVPWDTLDWCVILEKYGRANHVIEQLSLLDPQCTVFLTSQEL